MYLKTFTYVLTDSLKQYAYMKLRLTLLQIKEKKTI